MEFKIEDLISPEYQFILRQKFKVSPGWGKYSGAHAKTISDFAAELGARSILDYGCGKGTLTKAHVGIPVERYDPGNEQFDKLPEPADLVTCMDVLEHIEPNKLRMVMTHIAWLTRKGAFFIIATTTSRQFLPDGRNAHLIVQPKDWWLDLLRRHGWKFISWEERKGLWVQSWR